MFNTGSSMAEPVRKGKFVGRTVLITGASRGIGKEIGIKLAKDGANIVIAAKTATAHPKLPGTIYSAAEEIIKAGGKALPCVVDVRDEKSVNHVVEEAVKKFGGIDILINNASAISLTNTEDTDMKRYDLMHSINTRGTYLMTKACLPYLKQGKNPHVLNISPPLLMEKQWFANHVAYTMAKYGMSMCVLGHSEEFRPFGVGVNALWPLTGIWTAAMDMLSAGGGAAGCRKTDIMADAAYAILSRNSRDFTGNFCIDEDILREEGVTDFTKYAMDPDAPLIPDFFIPGGKYDKVFTTNTGRQKSREEINKAVAGQGIGEVLKTVNQKINKQLVDKLKAVYQFKITGDVTKTVILDLKNGEGSMKEGEDSAADVKFTCNAEDFPDLFSGRLSATNAFMQKKLKIQGDMSKALALEGVLKAMNKSKL